MDAKYDVFLGGPYDEYSVAWRLSVMKSLEELSMTFCNPRFDETSFVKNCKVLLYVIGKKQRGISECCEAAHSIGAGEKTVLVIEPYVETLDNISESQEVNLARSRLREIANEHGVIVFDYACDNKNLINMLKHHRIHHP